MRFPTLGKAVLSACFLTGCQFSYVVNSGWEQAKLYSKRVKIEEVLKDERVSPEIKKKLRLVQEALKFAEGDLGLKATRNYRQFVQLDRPYVTYIIHAAPPFELKSHRWWFPLIGHVPYKGFFSKEKADREAASFSAKEFDVFVRGVTAYSTLGWFNDPVWSSMMRYSDHDLVNTIIHETVHATVFFKSQADFNERMAVFLGDLGTELFYEKKEGPASPTIEKLRQDREDRKLFSEFISKEMADLRLMYEKTAGLAPDLRRAKKSERMKEILTRFDQDVKPNLKSGSFSGFASEPLDNARLLAHATYFEDLTDFQKLRSKIGPGFKALLAYLRNLSSASNPEAELRRFVSTHP